MSLTGVLPIEEWCSLHAVELHEVAGLMLLRHPESDAPFFSLCKGGLQFLFGTAEDDVFGHRCASFAVFQPKWGGNVFFVLGRAIKQISVFSHKEFGLGDA